VCLGLLQIILIIILINPHHAGTSIERTNSFGVFKQKCLKFLSIIIIIIIINHISLGYVFG
jgi:hypothetical protein